MALILEIQMRDGFHSPNNDRAPTYERPFLEAPAPSSLEPPPSHARTEATDEDDERERVIIIDI